MNTQVYLHESFGSLLMLLVKLRVIGVTHHKISHAAMMIRGQTPYVDPKWIPLPIVSTYMEFIEVKPLRRCS